MEEVEEDPQVLPAPGVPQGPQVQEAPRVHPVQGGPQAIKVLKGILELEGSKAQ